MNTLFTIGYTGRTLDELAAIVQSHNATLVDTRFSPYSRVPHWNGGALRQQFGDRYVWMGKTLGNVNYKNGGDIKLAAPDKAVAPIAALLAKQPVILMCACVDIDSCHRADVAEYLEDKLDCDTVHLPPPSRQKKAKAAPQVIAPPKACHGDVLVELLGEPYTLTTEGSQTRLTMADGRSQLFVSRQDADADGQRLAARPVAGKQIEKGAR